MPLQIIDQDSSVSVSLLKKFEKLIPDAILVSTNSGFETLERALKTGLPVIAYGPDPHCLGDPRYLGAFDGHKNYAYVNFPDGLQYLLKTYQRIVDSMQKKPERSERKSHRKRSLNTK